MSVEILKEENRFVVKDEKGNMTAEITFVQSGESVINIDHTYVDDSLRGMGVGVKLVEKVVEDARGQGKKVLPTCSFAKTVFERKSEFQDVLAK